MNVEEVGSRRESKERHLIEHYEFVKFTLVRLLSIISSLFVHSLCSIYWTSTEQVLDKYWTNSAQIYNVLLSSNQWQTFNNGNNATWINFYKFYNKTNTCILETRMQVFICILFKFRKLRIAWKAILWGLRVAPDHREEPRTYEWNEDVRGYSANTA